MCLFCGYVFNPTLCLEDVLDQPTQGLECFPHLFIHPEDRISLMSTPTWGQFVERTKVCSKWALEGKGYLFMRKLRVKGLSNVLTQFGFPKCKHVPYISLIWHLISLKMTWNWSYCSVHQEKKKTIFVHVGRNLGAVSGAKFQLLLPLVVSLLWDVDTVL